MGAVFLLLISLCLVCPGMNGHCSMKSLPKTIHLFAMSHWFLSSITQPLGVENLVFHWHSWTYQNLVTSQVFFLTSFHCIWWSQLAIFSCGDQKYFVPVVNKNNIRAKEGLSSVVYVQSSCDAPSERDSYVKELQKYINIDSYGKCLNNKLIPKQLSRFKKNLLCSNSNWKRANVF